MNDTDASMNVRLRELYSRAFSKFQAAHVDSEGLSGLHTLVVPESYSRTDTKLMVVGQETRGWGAPEDEMEVQLRRYVRFDLGKRFMRTPFWHNSHALNNALNQDGPNRIFLWSNLVKISRLDKRPSAEVEELVGRLGLIRGEIQITQPDAVVFFTGPGYDSRLRQTFPGVTFHSVSNLVYRLQHSSLPELTFRTYHPHYLTRSGNRHVIPELADLVKDRTPTAV